MVDALNRARTLTPGGVLIDIHPTPEAAFIEVGEPGAVPAATGGLHHEDGQRRHAAADRALAAVLKDALFVVEAAEEFWFRRYADSIEELRDYITDNWTNAWIDEATMTRTREAHRARSGASVWVREQVRMTKLRPGV